MGAPFTDFLREQAAKKEAETKDAKSVVNEQATIYSIVDSLLFNLPEVHQVKILVGGAEHQGPDGGGPVARRMRRR